MAWTEITRSKYQRDGLRYASDTTDAEWAVIELQMPAPATCGRPRGTSLREVVNATARRSRGRPGPARSIAAHASARWR